MKQCNETALSNQIVYQIYPKSFLDTTGSGIGDINGIRQKLQYLADLGVDYLWLSPINASPQRDNGYDISDYNEIDPMFGTKHDYLALIEEAKALNMKIMMDLVLNHTSDAHVWFQKALANDPKYKNYYIFREQPNEMTSIFGGSAWTFSEALGQYYFHFFDVHQPDLNWENPEVRNELYASINHWIALGVEGFRLDVIDLIGKEPDRYIGAKGPKFYEYLQELNQNTFGNRLLSVGECWGATFEDAAKMCGKEGLTQVFHFHHLTATHQNGKWNQCPLPIATVMEVIQHWQNDYLGIEAIVMNNHDSPRLLSLWLNDEKYRVESAKLLLYLFGLLHGNFYLYQGEEIGMTNAHWHDIQPYNDVETHNQYHAMKQLGMIEDEIMNKIALVSRDNARTPMQWDNQKNAGFSEGTPWLQVNENYPWINVASDLEREDSIYRSYQAMFAFRKSHPHILNQSISFVVEDNVVIMRKGSLVGYYHFGAQERSFDFADIQSRKIRNGNAAEMRIDGQEATILFHNYREFAMKLRPYEAIVFELI